jgi:hypothetical protein
MANDLLPYSGSGRRRLLGACASGSTTDTFVAETVKDEDQYRIPAPAAGAGQPG